MQAVRFHRHGGPEVLVVEDVPRPEPGPGELRVAVRAVALNHLDVLVRRGLPLAIEMPHVGGADFAGVVEALGPGVRDASVGERVVGYPVLPPSDPQAPPGPLRILGEQRNGACCEALVLPRANLLPMPERLSFEEAAAVPVAFLTAWTMLAVRARLAAGETVLVQGAGSGVGTAAIQIARHLGARVLAATHSPAKAPALRALGADEVLVAGRERLHLRVQRLTGRRGADVVFEHVGAATWDESVRSAAFRGRIVTCGATTGAVAQTNLAFVFAKELAILGATLGNREDLAAVLDLVQQGRLRPVVDRVLPLAACRAGHEILEAGAANGKVVLAVSPREDAESRESADAQRAAGERRRAAAR
jgi:NADPH:quinone reductase-like Zn-dependent oxidoreductase